MHNPLSGLKRLNAKFKIRQGYCPLCDSSPPEPNCLVCDGTGDYGSRIKEGTKELWLSRWDDVQERGQV